MHVLIVRYQCLGVPPRPEACRRQSPVGISGGAAPVSPRMTRRRLSDRRRGVCTPEIVDLDSLPGTRKRDISESLRANVALVPGCGGPLAVVSGQEDR